MDERREGPTEEREGSRAQDRRRMKQKRRVENLRLLAELALVVLLAVLIRHYLFMLTLVSGQSMEETLHDNQIVAVDKLSYRLSGPQRGDIVICHYPQDERNFVKRVVAVEGDTLEIRGGRTYLNGELLPEEYIAYPAWNDFGPIVVGKDEVFVMGDNRANSHDSRAEGPLPLSLLEGKVFAVLYPLDQMHMVNGAAQQAAGD